MSNDRLACAAVTKLSVFVVVVFSFKLPHFWKANKVRTKHFVSFGISSVKSNEFYLSFFHAPDHNRIEYSILRIG